MFFRLFELLLTIDLYTTSLTVEYSVFTLDLDFDTVAFNILLLLLLLCPLFGLPNSPFVPLTVLIIYLLTLVIGVPTLKLCFFVLNNGELAFFYFSILLFTSLWFMSINLLISDLFFVLFRDAGINVDVLGLPYWRSISEVSIVHRVFIFDLLTFCITTNDNYIYIYPPIRFIIIILLIR